MSLPSPAEIASALIAREEMPPEKGDIGPQGLEGKAGEFGPPGPQGAKGDPGRNGTNGSNGNVGPVGPQGSGGPRGPKGEKGDKGDEGERGPIGPMGPTGAVGSGKALFPRPGGGSSGGAPSGAAGGDLSGTYPNPSVVNDSHSHTGATITGVSGLPPQWTDGGDGDVTATVDDVAKTPLTLEAMTGQTGHLFRWYDENGVLKGNIDFEGLFDATRVVVQTPPDTGTVGTGVTINPGNVNVANDTPGDVAFVARSFPGPNSYFTIKTPGLGSDNGYVEFQQINNADTMFLMVAGLVPSSDHLQLWNNAFDAKLFRITKTGAPGTSSTAVADADLAAGEVAIYFDPTNGASALKIKGKSANGTVVTATVPLT